MIVFARWAVRFLGHLKRHQVFMNWNDFSIAFAHLGTGVIACVGCQTDDILSAPSRRHLVLVGLPSYTATIIHVGVRRRGEGEMR